MRGRWWLLVLALAWLAACSAPPAGLRVSPDEVTLEPGEELELVASGADPADLVWAAEHGTLVVDGDRALYRAPDYAVDDVVEVVRASDPRERVLVSVRVRGAGALTPRIRVISDLALVLTHAGEERELAVVVHDAAGHPDPDATVTFTSDAPDRVAVEALGPRRARVRALKDDVGSVRLRIRSGDAETYAWAVVARLQPQARRIEPDWILDARWEPDERAWRELVLLRSPETEALAEGQVVFSGDRAGVWGRVAALRKSAERIVLSLDPAELSDVFAELDYRASLPPYPAAFSGDAEGTIQLHGPGGSEQLLRSGACTGWKREGAASGSFAVEGELRLRIRAGALTRARWRAHLGGTLEYGPLSVESAEADPSCQLTRLQAELPPISWLLFQVALGVEMTSQADLAADAAPARVQLPGWRVRVGTDRLWEAGAGARAGAAETPVPETSTGPQLRFDEPGSLTVRRTGRLRLTGRAGGRGAPLAAGDLSRWGGELALSAALAGTTDPTAAEYQGPEWALSWQAEPPGATGASLAALLAEVAEVAPLPAALPQEGPRVLAAAPRVWGHLDTGGVRRLDLGSDASEPAARFNFEAEPELEGIAEVWLRGGACEDADACFSGPLRRVAAVSFPDGPLFWRPGKDDRGVYEVYLRYRIGPVGRELPYTARPPEPRLLVLAPDLQDLPLALELHGAPGGLAVGVLSVANPALQGVTPEGETVTLTSPLRLWAPGEGKLRTQPRRLQVEPGTAGHQRLLATCPPKATSFTTELTLYSNDPELPQVELPVSVICEGAPPPRLRLSATPEHGAAPLSVRFTLETAGAGAEHACVFDPGDGGPPFTWATGACPQRVQQVHVYERPGRYRAVLLVRDRFGLRDLAAADVNVD